MNLYKSVIIDAFGKSKRYVVAPSAKRAADFIKEYYRSIGEQLTKTSVHRIDEVLEGEDRDGLEVMLANAPIGFAIQAAIGWIVHSTVKPTLGFYRILDQDEAEIFVVAPNADIASALYVTTLLVAERVDRRFTITNAASSSPADSMHGMSELLEFGPVGIAEFDPDRGWFVR